MLLIGQTTAPIPNEYSMRSELDVFLDKVADPTLRANIRSQVDRLRAKRTFGLVFESHLPERVRLPEHGIKIAGRVPCDAGGRNDFVEDRETLK